MEPALKESAVKTDDFLPAQTRKTQTKTLECTGRWTRHYTQNHDSDHLR